MPPYLPNCRASVGGVTRALAKRYGVNQKTVAKWKQRKTVADLPTGPKDAKSTVLSVEEEAIIVAFRRHTLLPLDDCLYALHVEDAEAPAVGELVVDEVQRPAGVGPGLHQDRGPGPHSLAVSPPLADGEPLFPIKPVDPVNPRRLALPPQQDERPAVAEPPPFVGEPRHGLEKLGEYPDYSGLTIKPSAAAACRRARGSVPVSHGVG